VTPKVLKITNGNHTAWNSPTIILNAAVPFLMELAFGFRMKLESSRLVDFRGRFNPQPFNPGYEQVREVTIEAHGFQLA